MAMTILLVRKSIPDHVLSSTPHLVSLPVDDHHAGELQVIHTSSRGASSPEAHPWHRSDLSDTSRLVLTRFCSGLAGFQAFFGQLWCPVPIGSIGHFECFFGEAMA